MSHYDKQEDNKNAAWQDLKTDWVGGLYQFVKDDEKGQAEQDEWEFATIKDCESFQKEQEYDEVNKPKHYNSYPGVEVIQLTQHMNFCRGNAVKYLARAEFKGNELQDLEKALWYINKEIERMKNNDK